MKVCLVRPLFQDKSSVIHPPFALVTMAPYFEEPVTICDLQNDDVLPKNCDIYAFTSFTSQLPSVNNLIKILSGKAKFVVGGPAVTSDPEYARKLVPNADLLFAGDGEFFAENLEWISTLKFRSVIDYRKIPYPFVNKKVPLWNLTNVKQYKTTTGLGIETSRGCPFNCIMCTAHIIHGKQWVARKPLDVVEELKFLKQKYGCTKFYFADDNATANPSRWFNLMRDISVSQLGLTLSVPEGIQAHHLDYETLVVMRLAGLRRFTIGAESGNQRVLDKVINKGGLTVEKIEEVVRNTISLGMKPSCFFVIGFIGETLEEAMQTVEFAEKLRHLGAENCIVRNAIPMPGTQLFNIAKKENYLTVSEDKLFDFKCTHSSKHLLRTPDWQPEQIEALVAKAKLQESKHYLRNHPSILIKHPRSGLRLLLK